MRKIPTLYLRDEQGSLGPARRYVLDGEINTAAAWVIAGEGTPTRKYDGVCVGLLDAVFPIHVAARDEHHSTCGRCQGNLFGAPNVLGCPGGHAGTLGWYVRRELKPGGKLPHRFYPEQTDDVTGKTVGWEPAHMSGFHRFLVEAATAPTQPLVRGTYELCGPRINKNPDKFEVHTLVKHSAAEVPSPVLRRVCHDDPATLVRYFAGVGWEGIVWHHPDGRMAKLKGRDLP